jgi:hypothetical protein
LLQRKISKYLCKNKLFIEAHIVRYQDPNFVSFNMVSGNLYVDQQRIDNGPKRPYISPIQIIHTCLAKESCFFLWKLCVMPVTPRSDRTTLAHRSGPLNVSFICPHGSTVFLAAQPVTRFVSESDGRGQGRCRRWRRHLTIKLGFKVN